MNADKQWLVKSNDSVLGPYEFDRVVENIFNGDIHLLDEIKGPFERWRPIKDHSLFAAAIEKLKASTYQARGEHTMTATLDIHTKTDTPTQTVSVIDQETATETPHIHGEEDNMEPTRVYQPPQAMEAPIPPNSAVHRSAQSQKKRFPLVFVFSFLLLVIGGAGYLVYEFKQSKLIEQKISAFDQFTDAGMENLKVGEYEKALKNFSKAYNISPNDSNLLIEMSPLAIQFGGQFNQVQTNIESMLAKSRQKTINKIGNNIVGLSYSYRGKFAEALANYDEALNFDNQFMPAQLNKAYALMKVQKAEQAVSLMRQVVAENKEKSVAHFFYIRALLELGLKNEDDAILSEVLSVADQFAQRHYDFKQEVAFLVAIANSKLDSEPENLLKHVKNFLKIDFELTNLHVHDPLIDFQGFNWLDFIPMCNKLASGLGDFHSKLLNGFCLLKVRRTIEAKNIFEDLLSQQNEDGILQALYASSLLKLEELSQAKNSLGFLSQMDQQKPLIETILRGCLVAGDMNCGRAIFKGQHSKHLSLLYSHWGNASLLLKDNRSESRASIREGLGQSPNFAPLLKMQKKL